MKFKTDNGYEVAGFLLPTVRAANSFANLLRRLGLFKDEYIKEPPYWRTVWCVSQKRIVDEVTLADLKAERNCGTLTISHIRTAMIKAGHKPSWKWPEEKQWPKWMVIKCPHCGAKLYDK